MKVYVVLIEDRHCDPEVHVFRKRKDAVDEAKALLADYARHVGDVRVTKLNADMRSAGWVYRAQYSCEGDRITVIETVLAP